MIWKNVGETHSNVNGGCRIDLTGVRQSSGAAVPKQRTRTTKTQRHEEVFNMPSAKCYAARMINPNPETNVVIPSSVSWSRTPNLQPSHPHSGLPSEMENGNRFKQPGQIQADRIDPNSPYITVVFHG